MRLIVTACLVLSLCACESRQPPEGFRQELRNQVEIHQEYVKRIDDGELDQATLEGIVKRDAQAWQSTETILRRTFQWEN